MRPGESRRWVCISIPLEINLCIWTKQLAMLVTKGYDPSRLP